MDAPNPPMQLAALHIRVGQNLTSVYLDMLTASETRTEQVHAQLRYAWDVLQQIKDGDVDIAQVMITDDGVRVIPRRPKDEPDAKALTAPLAERAAEDANLLVADLAKRAAEESRDNGAAAKAQVAPCEEAVADEGSAVDSTRPAKLSTAKLKAMPHRGST